MVDKISTQFSDYNIQKTCSQSHSLNLKQDNMLTLSDFDVELF